MKNAVNTSLTQEQQSDVALLMSLNTPELIQEWIEAVGKEDVAYGISLLHIAAYEATDNHIDAESRRLGESVLAKFTKSNG